LARLSLVGVGNDRQRSLAPASALEFFALGAG